MHYKQLFWQHSSLNCGLFLLKNNIGVITIIHCRPIPMFPILHAEVLGMGMGLYKLDYVACMLKITLVDPQAHSHSQLWGRGLHGEL
jgi:hypothetical protein